MCPRGLKACSVFQKHKVTQEKKNKKVFLLNSEIGVRQNVDYSLNARQSHHQELLRALKILLGIKV